MAHHKLLLDDDLNEEFSLIAIHCSEEDYKMAYTLNKQLNLRLERQKEDLELSYHKQKASFPIYEFEDQFQYTQYYLVANKCKQQVIDTQASSSLFSEEDSEKVMLHYLLPEFKNADYFLKIASDFQSIPMRKNIALINELNQVISAYEVDQSKIKSSQNLIFN
ncbi:MAG: IPExxxVDY family protein [Flavobacteriaceae bacterium]|nr:IPExxxVDY family protein [Flavobacteriaceae bacterium]